MQASSREAVIEADLLTAWNFVIWEAGLAAYLSSSYCSPLDESGDEPSIITLDVDPQMSLGVLKALLANTGRLF